MSSLIIEPGDPESVGPAPVPRPQLPPEPSVAPPPPAVEAPSEPKMYPEDIVRSLRDENAKWRTRTQRFESAFADMSDEDVEAYLSYIKLSNLANSGNQDAINELTAAGLWEAASEPAPEPTPEDRPLTRREFEQLLTQQFAERDARQAEAANMAYLHKEARDLGYEPGTPNYALLINIADSLGRDQVDLGGKSLLEVAHQGVQDHYQKQWERFMERKTTESQQGITLPTNGGAPIPPVNTPSSRMELRDRVAERFKQGI